LEQGENIVGSEGEIYRWSFHGGEEKALAGDVISLASKQTFRILTF
jgi:hypothetical protein